MPPVALGAFGAQAVFLTFNLKPFRAFLMSGLGAGAPFLCGAVRIGLGPLLSLWNWSFRWRRVGIVVQDQPLPEICDLFEQSVLGGDCNLQGADHRAKQCQHGGYCQDPVGAACAVGIIARLAVGEDLSESALHRHDPMRNMQGQIEPCDSCPSETPAGSCGPKRHLKALNCA